MKVFCYKHGKLMELIRISEVGNTISSLKYNCPENGCETEVEIQIETKILIKIGVDVL